MWQGRESCRNVGEDGSKWKETENAMDIDGNDLGGLKGYGGGQCDLDRIR